MISTFATGLRESLVCWLSVLAAMNSVMQAEAGGAEVLFVSNYLVNSGNVTQFDYDGTSLTPKQVITLNVNGPTGLAFDIAGNLLVANFGAVTSNTSRVVKYSPDSNGNFSFDSQFTSPGAVAGARGVAVGEGGHVYVANTDLNRLSIFDTAGALQANITGLSSQPRGIAFGPEGYLYMANYDNRIRIFDMTDPIAPSQIGTITNTGGIALNGSQGIAFDASGRMFVSNALDDSVSILRFTGGNWVDDGKIASGGNLDGPYGMDFDSEGNLFIANFDTSNIAKYRPDNGGFSFVTSFSAGITSPTFIRFHHAVPEPSTLVLTLLAGSAAIACRSTKRDVVKEHALDSRP